MGAWCIALSRVGACEKVNKQVIAVLLTAVKRHSYPGLSYVLPAAALHLAIIGRSERALELYGLICEKTIYGNTPWLEDVVGKRIKQLASCLPPEEKEAAYERGKRLDLFETAAKLLKEFEAQSSSE